MPPEIRNVVDPPKITNTVSCQRWLYFVDQPIDEELVRKQLSESIRDAFRRATKIWELLAFSWLTVWQITPRPTMVVSLTVGVDVIIVTLQLDCGLHGEPRDEIDDLKDRLRVRFNSKSLKSDDDCWHIVDPSA